MGYIHVEVEVAQRSKRNATTCGDVVKIERTEYATTIVCADGIGSGVKAHISATMAAARFMDLLKGGLSMRDAFSRVVDTMETWRSPELPYSVLTAVRILNHGETTVLSYEMPPPLLFAGGQATTLPLRYGGYRRALIGEVHCHIRPGEGIILVSDGITESGLGLGWKKGWTIEGVRRRVEEAVTSNGCSQRITSLVLNESREIDAGMHHDDSTVVSAICREGRVLNILTGPPGNRDRNREVINRFLSLEGCKIVCGGTTSKLVADAIGTEMELDTTHTSLYSPPRYKIAYIDLATEGRVMLNQLFNVLDSDPEDLEPDNPVRDLLLYIESADRVNFTVGLATNPSATHISYRQQGFLSRSAIVPLIAEALRKRGKLVVEEYI